MYSKQKSRTRPCCPRLETATRFGKPSGKVVRLRRRRAEPSSAKCCCVRFWLESVLPQRRTESRAVVSHGCGLRYFPRRRVSLGSSTPCWTTTGRGHLLQPNASSRFVSSARGDPERRLLEPFLGVRPGRSARSLRRVRTDDKEREKPGGKQAKQDTSSIPVALGGYETNPRAQP